MMIKSLYQKIFSEKTRYNFHINLRKAKAFFLSGNSFYCPCCSKSAHRFLEKGNGIEIRSNAVCPHCGSLERTRLLFLYLKDNTQIFENNPHILHFAPEDALKKYFTTNPNYIDADLNPNLATHQMDITDISFPDNYFDFIICSHVLGHVPNEQKALQELYRVLKTGGSLFLLSLMDLEADKTLQDSSFTSPEQKLRSYGEKDLERLYGNDFADRIKADIVRIDRIDYRREFSEEDRQRMALGNGRRELIYLVTKI